MWRPWRMLIVLEMQRAAVALALLASLVMAV